MHLIWTLRRRPQDMQAIDNTVRTVRTHLCASVTLQAKHPRGGVPGNLPCDMQIYDAYVHLVLVFGLDSESHIWGAVEGLFLGLSLYLHLDSPAPAAGCAHAWWSPGESPQIYDAYQELMSGAVPLIVLVFGLDAICRSSSTTHTYTYKP